ncbi:hypothetical protein XELAEV_18041612mg [Xenopus laevis]|uniref:Uncharacterized protein n=1 Tax=Xenopus laevis TaxID=8355 RepID=A0A974H5A9_XENLA|nr:hypothetical protein XELAEV_18041612mg [Xenopus laevis]
MKSFTTLKNQFELPAAQWLVFTRVQGQLHKKLSPLTLEEDSLIKHIKSGSGKRKVSTIYKIIQRKGCGDITLKSRARWEKDVGEMTDNQWALELKNPKQISKDCRWKQETGTLTQFWEEIICRLNNVMRIQITTDPVVCLLGVFTSADLQQVKKHFLALFQARRQITKNWKADTAPDVKARESDLHETGKLEKYIYKRRDKLAAFTRIWGKWFEYCSVME